MRPFGALAVGSSRFLAVEKDKEEAAAEPRTPPPPRKRRSPRLGEERGGEENEENKARGQRVRVGPAEEGEESRWRSGAWQAGLAAAGASPGSEDKKLVCSLAWVRLEGHWRRAPLLLAMIAAVRATHHDCAVEVCLFVLKCAFVFARILFLLLFDVSCLNLVVESLLI
jgi:hypothetical protein